MKKKKKSSLLVMEILAVQNPQAKKKMRVNVELKRRMIALKSKLFDVANQDVPDFWSDTLYLMNKLLFNYIFVFVFQMYFWLL